MDTQTLAIAVLLISFLVMILLRFPIAYAVALSSVLCLQYISRLFLVSYILSFHYSRQIVML